MLCAPGGGRARMRRLRVIRKLRRGMSPAEIVIMRNRCAESRDPTTKAVACKRSLLICAALQLLCCSVSGAATQPASDARTLSVTVTASEALFARGIDISPSAGEPTLGDFENIRQQGYRFVIVAGWGGVNPNGHAHAQLSRARGAGLLTAGYCYLNFASPLDGGRQVREALAAFGTESTWLGFLAIDVETSAWNQLSPGLQSDPPDAAAQRRAVARIAEAVQQAQQMGLSAIIYTKKDDWQRVTGDTQQFRSLPLWHPKTTGGDDLNQPDLASPGYTFGGWTSRVGKQFELDTVLNRPPIPVDLDVFDLNAFSADGPNYRGAVERIFAAD